MLPFCCRGRPKTSISQVYTRESVVTELFLHIPFRESSLTAEIEHRHRPNCARIPHELSSHSAVIEY